MTNEAISELNEVECLFCGELTPRPVITALRRSFADASGSHIRVSIIRCHHCGKEAPYPYGQLIRAEEPKAKRAGAA